jgi:hypothetical protein
MRGVPISVIAAQLEQLGIVEPSNVAKLARKKSGTSAE